MQKDNNDNLAMHYLALAYPERHKHAFNQRI